MVDRLRSAFLPGLLLALALSLCAPGPGRADEEEEEPQEDVNVLVEGTLDKADAATTGQVVLNLKFIPQEDIDRPYSIQLRLMAFRVTVLQLDHAPKPGTVEWKKGRAVQYHVPVPLPLSVKPNSELALFLGFYDPQEKRAYPPRMEGSRQGELRLVAELTMPDFGPLENDAEGNAAIDKLLAAAAGMAAEGRKTDAWSTLEVGLRRCVEDEPKYRFRDALVALGAFPPAPISILETEIVQGRIEQEKHRYLRLISGRCFDRKQYHGALRILEAVGGKLSEDARGAVIGALDQAQRAQKDISDLKVRILGRVTDEEQAQADKAVASLGYTKKLLDQADAWRKKRQWAPARLVLRTLALNAPDRAVAHAATELQTRVEEAWLDDTPAVEEAIVSDALNHPVWARTKSHASHKFIFIGPEALITSIPPESSRRFDLAYIFLTDLFGRRPNPGGDRVTVYFKELWDFGGGVGGGKRIDIGKADRMRPGTRVDNGLLYHELTHCVDDTNPIFPGWREGLANFGAAYAFEALGQTSDSLHGFEKNLQAFRDDYLDRDLVYWRIPNYGPSAGFFLHFVETHSKVGRRHDWRPYRKFFREYRRAPIRDGRAPYVGRAVAYFLVRAFGPKAFDDLLTFRFPLVEADRDAVTQEMEAFASGGYRLDRVAKKLDGHPNSPLPRDVLQGAMMGFLRSRDHESATRVSKEKLGILHDWKVIGPFRQKGAHPGAFVFPPEKEIDYAKEYPGEANVCRWRDPGRQGVVHIDATGYVHVEFNYMENTATYGLTYVTVPEAMDAVVHVRADDDLTIFLNDRLIENFIDKGSNSSSFLSWRGPGAPVPDQMKLPVRLEQGRNKLLVKVRNRRGKAGFIVAVVKPNGQVIPGIKSDTDPPPPEGTSKKPNPRRKLWTEVLELNFRAKKSFSSRLDTQVGKFKVVKGALVGQDDGKRVGWRKYTVRPGFPKDAPSNLIWIKPRYTDGLDAFRLEMDFLTSKRRPPKVAIQVQGEGGTDGLSGWNLILHPRGKGNVGAQIERYEHMYYQVPPTALEAAPPEKKGKRRKKKGKQDDPPKKGKKVDEDEPLRLVMTYKDRRLTVSLGDVTLFDAVSITPIRTGSRIGFSLWPNGDGVSRIELSKPKLD